MTDSENKYDQRIRQRAEEIVSITHPITAQRAAISPYLAKNYQKAIDRTYPIARLSVQREAEAYYQAYAIGRDMENDPYSRAGLKTMLQSLGLVPENVPGNVPVKK